MNSKVLAYQIFLFAIFPVLGFSQKFKNKVVVLNVYHMNENVCLYSPNDIDVLKEINAYTKCYTGRKLKKGLSIELEVFLESKDTLKKSKLKGFSPYFLIEYKDTNSILKYIAFDQFGRYRASFFESKDSVLNSEAYLITILENNIKQLKKDRRKQNGK